MNFTSTLYFDADKLYSTDKKKSILLSVRSIRKASYRNIWKVFRQRKIEICDFHQN